MVLGLGNQTVVKRLNVRPSLTNAPSSSPVEEYILKGVVNAALGQEIGSVGLKIYDFNLEVLFN